MIDTKNNGTKEQNFFYMLLLMVQPLIIIALVLNNEILERALSYLIYASALAIFLMRFSKNEIKKADCFLLGFLLFFVLKIVLFREGKTSLISFISFFIMLIAYGAGDDIKETERIKKTIMFSYVVQAIIFCALSLSDYSYKSYVENSDVADALTLGIANPNQTGIMLFVNIVVLLWGSKNIKTKFVKALLFVLCVWLFILLLFTKARTSIFAFIFVMLFYWLFANKEKLDHSKYGLFKAFIIALVPLVFLIVYLNIFKIEFFRNIEILGKKLISGRENVYINALNSWHNILFGDIAFFSFNNAHNAYLSILVNIGVIGFLLFFIFIINEIYKKAFCNHKRSSIVYWAFISTFLIACSESALLIGGSIYFVMLFTLCFLLNKE